MNNEHIELIYKTQSRLSKEAVTELYNLYYNTNLPARAKHG